MGFGTGLNALLTWMAVEHSNHPVEYVAVEKYPLPPVILNSLGYASKPEHKEKFLKLHSVDWETPVRLSGNFSMTKLKTDLDEIKYVSEFDLVYYDAFAPRVQPNMWTTEKLEVVSVLMKSGARLVTYCAQGQFRRNLKEAGFEWHSAPGPPGKREMTIAEKVM